ARGCATLFCQVEGLPHVPAGHARLQGDPVPERRLLGYPATTRTRNHRIPRVRYAAYSGEHVEPSRLDPVLGCGDTEVARRTAPPAARCYAPALDRGGEQVARHALWARCHVYSHAGRQAAPAGK